MAKLKCKMLQPTSDYETGELILALQIDRESVRHAKHLVDKYIGVEKLLSIDVRTWRNPRSLDANAYCWKLCAEIANVDEAGLLTKEEVYRRNILEVGVYDSLQVRQDALEGFAQRWEYRGTGWFVDLIDDGGLDGYKLVHAYYGSSVYNTKEMWRLLKQIEQDARSVGILIMTEQERTLIMNDWEEKSAKE